MRKQLIVLALVILFIGVVSAQGIGSYGTAGQYGSSTIVRGGIGDVSRIYGSHADTYWPILNNRDSCEAREDILLQISPVGCQPAVVRSDLLAEQDVPVFCQVDGLKLNPLVDITQIRNIRFSGDYPEEVRSVAFHPARAALRTQNTIVGSPFVENIGYVVIVLKRQEIEEQLPDSIEFTLTGQLDYEAGDAFGIGRAQFLLGLESDNEFLGQKYNEHVTNTFWKGRYSLRLDDVDPNKAGVTIYDNERTIASRSVERGKSSSDIFIPGSYCQGRMHLEYDGLETADVLATLRIGDDYLQVTKGSNFLNRRCRVVDIKTLESDEGTIELQCPGDRFDLDLGQRSLRVGESVAIIDSSGASDEGWTIDQILDGQVVVRKSGQNPQTLSLDSVRLDGENVLHEVIDNNDSVEEYFENALLAYESVVDAWPNEKNLADEYIGELALAAAANLAKDFQKQVTEERIITKLLQNYPNSEDFQYWNERLNNLYKVDAKLAGHTVYVDNEYHTIQLLGISVSDKKSSVDLQWGSQIIDSLEEGDSKPVQYGKISVSRIDSAESALVHVTCSAEDQKRNGGTVSLTLDDSPPKEACGERLVLVDVDRNERAKIRIETAAGRVQTLTNFSVGIGIEKRAIELNPERAAERIENLDESIERWEGIADGLGKTVEGFKSACFATAGVLTVKSFFEGLDGEGLARQHTMTGPNGWSARCQKAVNENRLVLPNGEIENGVTYNTVSQCLNANSARIDAEVNHREQIIESVNGRISNVEDDGKITNGGIFSSKVNVDEAKKEYLKVLKNTHGSEFDHISEDDLRAYSYADLREMDYQLSLSKLSGNPYSNVSSVAFESTKKKVDEKLKVFEELDRTSDVAGLNPVLIGSSARTSKAAVGEILAVDDMGKTYKGEIVDSSGNTITKYSGAMIVAGKDSNGSAKSFVVLGNNEGGVLDAKEIYEYDQSTAGTDTIGLGAAYPSGIIDFKTEFDVLDFHGLPDDTYAYPIKPAHRQVKYFETGAYKGLAAQVPLDVRLGWYVIVEPRLAVGNNIPSYASSGNPESFRICNVGPDGYIGEDDPCQRIDSGINEGQIFSLSEAKSRDLIRDAKKALIDASRQYGETTIRVDGESYTAGAPASASSQASCQEFMSPSDCQWLFNACDPVICPSSRCDFGGTYPVSDVIQSGIVGSALLCLPNWNEGVYVPVCLSGIHAGVEGYLSILESHKQCLQDSIDTGQLNGICDEVNSIYTCEFFWRQAAPLADIVVPKLFETVAGQGTRGGGEYATVANAWEQTQKSLDFFTQQYAVDSLNAFKIRSTADVGSQFCQGFVSAGFPIGADFEALIEPDSPHQFHAYFSSTPFSDATVPSTSQYKVFYHIFAGNDQGVSYSVYLKDPPQGSFYTTSPTVQVDSGFIPRGEFSTETIDFTAPEGYKQLCVRINGNEECGFKQVSTSFAINALKDAAVGNELLNTAIDDENECVSGQLFGVQPTAALNLNPQAAIEEAIAPQNYQRGIVRICATQNPGSATTPSRYLDVGHCGDESLRCWLDSDSVDNALSSNLRISEGIKTETLSSLSDEANQVVNQDQTITGDLFTTTYNQISARVDLINSVRDADSVMQAITQQLGSAFANDERARVDLLKGNVLAQVARKLRALNLPAPEVNPNAYPEGVPSSAVRINGEFGGEYWDPETNYIYDRFGEVIFSVVDDEAIRDLYISYFDEEEDEPEQIIFIPQEGYAMANDGKIYKDGEYIDLYTTEWPGDSNRLQLFQEESLLGLDTLWPDSRVGIITLDSGDVQIDDENTRDLANLNDLFYDDSTGRFYSETEFNNLGKEVYSLRGAQIYLGDEPTELFYDTINNQILQSRYYNIKLNDDFDEVIYLGDDTTEIIFDGEFLIYNGASLGGKAENDNFFFGPILLGIPEEVMPHVNALNGKSYIDVLLGDVIEGSPKIIASINSDVITVSDLNSLYGNTKRHAEILNGQKIEDLRNGVLAGYAGGINSISLVADDEIVPYFNVRQDYSLRVDHECSSLTVVVKRFSTGDIVEEGNMGLESEYTPRDSRLSQGSYIIDLECFDGVGNLIDKESKQFRVNAVIGR